MDNKARKLLIILGLIVCFSGCQKTKTSTKSSGSQGTTKNAASDTSSSTPSNTNTTATANLAPINVQTGTPMKSSLAIVNGSVTFYANPSDKNKLYKENADGTGTQKICDDSVDELLFSNNTIYYLNTSDGGKIYSISIDGTGRKKLTDDKDFNLILLSGYIYYINSTQNLSAINTVNNNITIFGVKTRAFDCDGKNLYVEDHSNNDALTQINLNGSTKTKLTDNPPISILAQDGNVYYTNGNDGYKIYSIISDGTKNTLINNVRASVLRFDSGYIYYINNSDFDKIYKMKIDGTENAKVNEEGFISNFFIVGDSIYLTKTTDPTKIYKISK